MITKNKETSIKIIPVTDHRQMNDKRDTKAAAQ